MEEGGEGRKEGWVGGGGERNQRGERLPKKCGEEEEDRTPPTERVCMRVRQERGEAEKRDGLVQREIQMLCCCAHEWPTERIEALEQLTTAEREKERRVTGREGRKKMVKKGERRREREREH